MAQRWEQLVTAALVASFAVGTLSAVGTQALPDALAAWSAAGHSAAALSVAVVLGVVALWMAALMHLGPMATSAATLQWSSISSPERNLHVRFLLRNQPVCWATAAVVSFVVIVLPQGMSSPSWWWGGALLATLGGSSLVCYRAELVDARDAVLLVSKAVALAAVAVFALSRSDVVVAALAVAVALVVLLSLRHHRRRLRPGDRPPTWLLVRAAENRWALHASAVLLDGSVARQTRHRWQSGTPLAAGAELALPGAGATRTWTLVQRHLPRGLVVVGLTGYLAACLVDLPSSTTPSTVLLVGIGVIAVSTSTASDLWSEAPALRRTYAAFGRWSGWLVSAAPLALTMLLAVVGAVVVRADLVTLVVLLVAPLLIVLRRRRSRGSGLGVWISTPMGVVPLGLVNRLVAGWDVVLVAVVVLSVW